MKIGIISDIHGNLEALTSALDVMVASQVDEIVCLGDIVGYGANPHECIELVRKQCTLVVLGNHDQAAVDLRAAEYFSDLARAAVEWTAQQLSPDEKQYLAGLPLTAERAEALLVHASPRQPGEWNYLFSESEARMAFGAFPHRICFVGHSHVPGVFAEHSGALQVGTGDRFIVNVGSVGQPRDGDPRLSVGIFDPRTWSYQNVRAPYDVDSARAKILDAGLPVMLGDRLLRGR